MLVCWGDFCGSGRVGEGGLRLFCCGVGMFVLVGLVRRFVWLVRGEDYGYIFEVSFDIKGVGSWYRLYLFVSRIWTFEEKLWLSRSRKSCFDPRGF